MNAQEWIKELNLLPHPEGGFYRETYRSPEEIIAPGFEGKRNVSTAIYFLLEEKNKSHFHRIKSDELWFFHEGETLEILCLSKKGMTSVLLGKNIRKGEKLQVLISAGTWFGARIKNETGYSLVSCTVAPGFDFKDFEMATHEILKKEFPEQVDGNIEEMTLKFI
jgi:predicted cupin superfamily sugar epimerase